MGMRMGRIVRFGRVVPAKRRQRRDIRGLHVRSRPKADIRRGARSAPCSVRLYIACLPDAAALTSSRIKGIAQHTVRCG